MPALLQNACLETKSIIDAIISPTCTSKVVHDTAVLTVCKLKARQQLGWEMGFDLQVILGRIYQLQQAHMQVSCDSIGQKVRIKKKRRAALQLRMSHVCAGKTVVFQHSLCCA